MKNRVLFAIFFVSVWGLGLISSPARAVQYGFSAGYSSIGFTLHGGSIDFLLGLGQGRGRPKGSVLRLGFAGMTGQGESDLTKAKWDGISYQDYTALPSSCPSPGSFQCEIAILGGGGGPGTQRGNQRVLELSGGSRIPSDLIAAQTRYYSELRERFDAYGIPHSDQPLYAGSGTRPPTPDFSSVSGDGTAYIVSAAYEYVLGKGAPGLGFLVGGEVVIFEGLYKSNNPAFPDVRTKGGLGGGGVLGASYYLKSGVNFTFKTGLGLLDPGEVTLLGVKIEPESSFYASPTFAIGYMY